jgi:hypothetical protein
MEAYVTREHSKVYAGLAVTNPVGVRANLGALRLHLLILLREYCGVDVGKKMRRDQAAMDADIAKMEASARQATVSRAPLPLPSIRLPYPDNDYGAIEIERPPATPPSVHCTTIKIGDDMSSTNCN